MNRVAIALKFGIEYRIDDPQNNLSVLVTGELYEVSKGANVVWACRVDDIHHITYNGFVVSSREI